MVDATLSALWDVEHELTISSSKSVVVGATIKLKKYGCGDCAQSTFEKITKKLRNFIPVHHAYVSFL